MVIYIWMSLESLIPMILFSALSILSLNCWGTPGSMGSYDKEVNLHFFLTFIYLPIFILLLSNIILNLVHKHFPLVEFILLILIWNIWSVEIYLNIYYFCSLVMTLI